MAVQKIEYQNKVSIVNDPTIPEINKVTDNNMNEIKAVVNHNADELTNIDLSAYQTIANLTDTISSESTNTQYAGAKAVYDYVDSILGTLDTLLTNLDTGNGVE